MSYTYEGIRKMLPQPIYNCEMIKKYTFNNLVEIEWNLCIYINFLLLSLNSKIFPACVLFSKKSTKLSKFPTKWDGNTSRPS